MNPGHLRKNCFKTKSSEANYSNTAIIETTGDQNTDNNSKETAISISTEDPSIMDIIKDLMLKDKLREAEMINVLKHQIEFLHCELKEMNKIIENLITRLTLKTSKQTNYLEVTGTDTS